MQRDLDALMDWGSTWGMKFNAKKCNIMRVSRSRKPLQHFYSLGNEILQEVSDAKYLGIQIDNKLDWNKHISTVAARGQSKLAFLNRNLKGCPKKLRDTAYISLIRPALEYSCSVWYPHKKSNKDKIEKVQRRAARFVSNNFRRKASVSEMLHELGWQSLDGRRQDQRLVLFFKIINGLASVETEVTGELPRDWSLANVAPIFKKGNRVLAENYRPVSLTCITCKLFEHIVCRHILDHIEDHKILTNLQHGFRSGRSCETQQITTTHDLLSSFNSKSQIDVAILDFSKAFDTVPHAGLLGKLEHYGIDSKILLWITNFLNNRKRVVVDGGFSNYADVESGVPQGTVLGPLLFLLHINDLPSCVNSKVRLFADDCLLYREIKNNQDQIDMQRDLDALMDWGSTWGMKFNAKKCNIMRVSRSRKPLQHFYSLGNEILQEVSDAKYLGIQIDNKLDWNKHISTVAATGQSKLAFLNRNLKGCPKKLRDTAYISLIRPTLEYSCSVWHPHKKSNKDKIEKVQRRAA